MLQTTALMVLSMLDPLFEGNDPGYVNHHDLMKKYRGLKDLYKMMAEMISEDVLRPAPSGASTLQRRASDTESEPPLSRRRV